MYIKYQIATIAQDEIVEEHFLDFFERQFEKNSTADLLYCLGQLVEREIEQGKLGMDDLRTILPNRNFTKLLSISEEPTNDVF